MRWKTIFFPSGEKSGYWSITPASGRVIWLTPAAVGFAS